MKVAEAEKILDELLNFLTVSNKHYLIDNFINFKSNYWLPKKSNKLFVVGKYIGGNIGNVVWEIMGI